MMKVLSLICLVLLLAPGIFAQGEARTNLTGKSLCYKDTQQSFKLVFLDSGLLKVVNYEKNEPLALSAHQWSTSDYKAFVSPPIKGIKNPLEIGFDQSGDLYLRGAGVETGEYLTFSPCK